MSPRTSFIRIRNWDRYQHYNDRRPPWIKLHVELLDKHETMTLPVPTRWLAIALLLLAAKTENVIDVDVSWLARASNLTPQQTERGLRELRQIRFVEPLSKKDLASAAIAEDKPSRARTRSASVSSLSVSEVKERKPTESQLLVAHYFDYAKTLDVKVPHELAGQLGTRVKRLLNEEFEPHVLRRAIELLVEKGLNISSLPSLAVEAQREPVLGKNNGRLMDISDAQIERIAEEVFHEAG